MRKGIIFDLDGVICSTDKYHYMAWKQLADKLGIYFDKEINHRLRGVGRLDSFNIILEKSAVHYSEEEKREFVKEKNEIYRGFLKEMTNADLSEEVQKTLEELQRRNVKMAIGSSSKNAGLILQKIGLENFFDAVVDGNCIENSKPNPEVFIKAAEKLGLDREECLIVEDAESGIEAAHAGNMKAAAIGKIVGSTDAEYKLGRFSDLLNLIDEGMPPENYHELLDKLKKNSGYVREKNYFRCEKPFLGEKRGYFDPLADKERGKPDKVYALPDEYKYKGIPIGEIRQTAGWNNFDISRGKVKTQIIEVPSEKKPITVECYMKENSPVKEKGCLIFFHGGGFVSGSVAAVRNICKGVAEAGDICVLNVDYSLSPEYFYPTAIEEGLAVAEYVKYHAEDMQIDRNRIGTAGDSAGGNIAGAVAVRDRRQGLNIIKYQALLYPAVVIDREKENELCPWSCRLYEIAEDDDKILRAMNYIKDFSPHIKTVYAGEADTANEDISLICNPRMGMLPDTLIVTAEYDYLRIQGEYYAERLAAKGVNVRLINYKGMDHAFLDKVGYFPQAEDCIRMIARDFNERMSSAMPCKRGESCLHERAHFVEHERSARL